MFIGLQRRGPRVMPALGAIAAMSLTHSSGASAQASNGASVEIRLQAFVPVYCALKSGSNRIILTGTTDSGQPVAVQLGNATRGLAVECNTPYAMNLDRVTTTLLQSLNRNRTAATTPSTESATATVAAGEPVTAVALHPSLAANDTAPANVYTVSVQLASRTTAGPGSGMLAQSCTYSDNDTACAITGGPDDLTPALARSTARFALVAHPSAANTADAVEALAVDLDEMARAGQKQVIPGVLLGPMKPAPNPISTASAPGRGTRTETRILNEHLRLSVTGRF